MRHIVLFMWLVTAPPAAAQISAEISRTTALTGTSFTSTVAVGSLTGKNVSAFEFTFDFNPAIVRFTGIDQAGTIADTMVCLANTATSGRVVVGCYGAYALEGSGKLLSLLGEAVSAGTTPVTLRRFVFNNGTPTSTLTSGSVQVNADGSPLARDDTAATDEDQGVVVDVLANDVDDVAVRPETVQIVSSPTSGAVAVNTSTGRVTYTPTLNFNGQDTFTYTVEDNLGSVSNMATVTVTVRPVNDPPVATSIAVRVLQDGTGGIPLQAMDVDGDNVTFAVTVPPAFGIVTLQGALAEYRPNPGFSGSDAFRFVAHDGTVSSSQADVTITVSPIMVTRATLSPFNLPVPASLTGTGTVDVTWFPEQSELSVSASFSGLSSAPTSASLMIGGPFESGTPLLDLLVSTSTIEPNLNTFKLNQVDRDAVVTALDEGRLFVVFTTSEHPFGSLRGNLRSESNAAPEPSMIVVPGLITITGEPGDVLYTIGFSTALDPDGHPVRHVLLVSADIGFTTLISATDVSSDADRSVEVTVAEAKAQFDQISGIDQGNGEMDGTVQIHYRMANTDGTAVSVGDVSSLTLVRGTVTGNDADGTLPMEFCLRRNFPNPFSDETLLVFDLPEAANVTVLVTDMIGRAVRITQTVAIGAGSRRNLKLDATGFESGVYAYRLLAVGAKANYFGSGTFTVIR